MWFSRLEDNIQEVKVPTTGLLLNKKLKTIQINYCEEESNIQ